MRRQNRINNPSKIDDLLIEEKLKEGNLIIVQFSDKIYSELILEELNELCQKYDDNFSVRFYGHHQNSFDCRTLSKIPNVKSLWIDCLSKVENLSQLTELKNLKRLSLGVYELKEKEILQAKNLQNLSELILGETKTKALNLKYLEDYKSLNRLILNGHVKNIDSIGELKNIEQLGLNSISKIPLTFVNNLGNLKALRFVLGGRESLAEIEENQIESLEITRVRGFNNLKNISNFKNLKRLLIEDQIQLKELYFEEEFSNLKDFKLLNCKSFSSLSGLQNLTSLHQLRISRTAINFDKFIKSSLPKSLEIFAFYTSKRKVDKSIRERLINLGFKDGLKK